MARTKSDKTYTCKKCEKEYKTLKGFEKHKCKPKQKVEKIEKTCDLCEVTFKTLKGYNEHNCKPKQRNLPKETDNQCELCNKTFKTERGLIRHHCHIKLRMEEYKEASGRIAFLAYQRFYSKISHNSVNRKEKTLLDFVTCSYYNGFYKFGKFVVDVNLPHYQEYLDFLIAYNVPLEKWSNDQVYDMYIKSLTKKEIPDRAVEKSLYEMSKWSKRTGFSWNEYFIKEDKYRIINSIRIGRISPWVIYNCKSGKEFMSLLDSSDLNTIFDFIDPAFWRMKFSRNDKERRAINDVLEQSGL